MECLCKRLPGIKDEKLFNPFAVWHPTEHAYYFSMLRLFLPYHMSSSLLTSQFLWTNFYYWLSLFLSVGNLGMFLAHHLKLWLNVVQNINTRNQKGLFLCGKVVIINTKNDFVFVVYFRYNSIHSYICK